MKKITAIIMIMAVVFAFASCGSKADDNATDSTETQSEVTVQAQAFKAGVWAVVKDGEEIGYYTFTDDMKQCSYETEKSGVPFDYEISGDSYIFHMGSVDNVTKAKVVFSGEDDCTITWDSPARTETLKYKGVKAFKAGVWAVVEDGEEVGYYTFTDDMKQCSYETKKSGVPFDYEISGDSYIFHMGSVDNITKAKVVFSGEDECKITWDDPARTETLKYKGAVEDENDSELDAAPLVINSEPYTVTAKDGFNNAGVTELKCDATEEYTFKAVSGDATWQIFILDKRFEDGARYLVQAEKPALTGDGELDIKAGQYIYVVCSESSFTADTASDSALEINYDD